jgi:hypothetical protein
VDLKRNKESFDARLSEVNKLHDKQLGVVDLMTNVWLGPPGAFVDAVDALRGQGEFRGRLAPFRDSKVLSAEALHAYFKALAEALGDPMAVPGEGSVNDQVRAAFRRYTECEQTSKSVLGKLTGAPIGADAVTTVRTASATTGSLRGGVSYKRGTFTSAGVAAFPLPTKDAVLLINGSDHIFTLAQVDKKWRLYQSFQNKYTVSQSGMGNAQVDDPTKFLSEITSAEATTWFGATADHDQYSYLILQ